MRNRDVQLVRELLSLYVKYGPEAFEAAVRELREGNVTQAIADAAENLQATAQRANFGRAPSSGTRSSKKSKHELLGERISRLRQSGLPSDAQIADLLEKILNREVLNSPNSLREYMSLIGVPATARLTDRYDSVRIIMEYLQGLPDQQKHDRIHAVDQFKNRESSLQRWADIIVKSDRSN
jgi:hypothetical protein